MVSCDGKDYIIGREEASMTRREAKDLAMRWIALNASRSI